MAEEMVDVEINLGEELAKEIYSMKKAELINRLVVMVLRKRVQDETVAKLEADAEKLKAAHKREIETLQTKLDKAEAYVEQGRAMIEAVMERWYEYDT